MSDGRNELGTESPISLSLSILPLPGSSFTSLLTSSISLEPLRERMEKT